MGARACILDASLVFSLGKAGRLDVLARTPGFRWHIAPVTRAELKSPETRVPVEQLILASVITPVELDSADQAGIELLAEWSELVGPGEAEAIAIGISRGWLIGLEDLQARRRLDQRVARGHWINCANVLLDAVQGGAMTLAEADGIFQALDVFSSYTKRGVTSLADLQERK